MYVCMYVPVCTSLFQFYDCGVCLLYVFCRRRVVRRVRAKAVALSSLRTGPTPTGPMGRASTPTRYTTLAGTCPAGSGALRPRRPWRCTRSPGTPTRTPRPGSVSPSWRSFRWSWRRTLSLMEAPRYLRVRMYTHVHVRIQATGLTITVSTSDINFVRSTLVNVRSSFADAY